jgi:hypothetical protein
MIKGEWKIYRALYHPMTIRFTQLGTPAAEMRDVKATLDGRILRQASRVDDDHNKTFSKEQGQGEPIRCRLLGIGFLIARSVPY